MDYRYSVIATYFGGQTPHLENKYIEIYAHSDETDEFAACMIGFSYKVEGEGIYTLVDYPTMNQDIQQGDTPNKYLYIHVNVASTDDDVAADRNMKRYGTTNDSGTAEFKIYESNYYLQSNAIVLVDARQDEGTPPANLPSSIILRAPSGLK